MYMPTEVQSSPSVFVLNMGPKAAGKMGSLQAKKRPKPTVYTTWTVLEQDMFSTLALPGLSVQRHLFRGHQSVGCGDLAVALPPRQPLTPPLSSRLPNLTHPLFFRQTPPLPSPTSHTPTVVSCMADTLNFKIPGQASALPWGLLGSP